MQKTVLCYLIAIVFSLVFSTNLLLSPTANAGPMDIGSSSKADTLPNVNDLSPIAVRELLSRLSDQEVRTILLNQLDIAAKQKEGASEHEEITSLIVQTVTAVGGSVKDAFIGIPNIISAFITGFSNFQTEHGLTGDGLFVGILGLSFLVAFLVEIVVNRVARQFCGDIPDVQENATFVETFKILSLRLFLDMLGLIAFFIVSAVIIDFFMPKGLLPTTDKLVSNLVVLPRLISALARFVLAPNRPDLRLVYTNDWTARFLHKNMVGLAFLIGFTYWIVNFLIQNGVSVEDIRIGFWLILTFYLWMAFMIFRARAGLTLMMAGKPDGPTSKIEAGISKGYPWAAIALTLLTWLLVETLIANRAWEYLNGRAELTLFILLITPAMDTLIRGLVKYRVKPMVGEGQLAEKAYQSTRSCYFRIGRVISFGFAILIIAGLWDINFTRLAAAGVGARAAGALFQFLLILSFGYLVWELVSLWINRKLAAELTPDNTDTNSEEPAGGEGGGMGASRISTVLPLIRFTLQSTIIVITLLVALGEIGVEITPLLAGAGIIGLAVGFGAQKLVSDIVSGIFFLVEDAFRVGEYLEVDGTMGTVEKISLRSFQLRHHKGPVHTIPYGGIPKVTNFSRDWVIMKLKFTVPFDTDLKKVKKIFKKIGKDMMEVPEFAEDFMQPFKSQGVLEVNDVGIVVRGKFMAKPGKQFTLRKEIYQRVQKLFDENGLQFARKQVHVKIEGSESSLSEEDKHAIAAAASDATDTPKVP